MASKLDMFPSHHDASKFCITSEFTLEPAQKYAGGMVVMYSDGSCFSVISACKRGMKKVLSMTDDTK